MSKQVTCIKRRSNHYDAHERITAIGGKNSSGGSWSMSEDDAIKAIEGKNEAFFVSVSGKTVDVVVASHNGRKYLKTSADGYSPNNLLSLDDCP
jgi:hypothetical protein